MPRDHTTYKCLHTKEKGWHICAYIPIYDDDNKMTSKSKLDYCEDTFYQTKDTCIDNIEDDEDGG